MKERMNDSNSLIRRQQYIHHSLISTRAVKQRYKARFTPSKSHKGTQATIGVYKYGLFIALLSLFKEPTPDLDCQQEESNKKPSK